MSAADQPQAADPARDLTMDEFAGKQAIQIIRYDGATLSIRSWVLDSAEEVERLAAELGEPGQEYLAPALADGFEKRVEL